MMLSTDEREVGTDGRIVAVGTGSNIQIFDLRAKQSVLLFPI